MKRERNSRMDCFIKGSLVATMELMAQIGLLFANSCRDTHNTMVAKKMLTA